MIQGTFTSRRFILSQGAHHQKNPKTLLKEKLQELYANTPPAIENIREVANQYFPEIATEDDTTLHDRCSFDLEILTRSSTLTPQQLIILKNSLCEKGGSGLTEDKAISAEALLETIKTELHVCMEEADLTAQCKEWGIFIEQNPQQVAQASQRSLGQVFSDEGTLDQLKSQLKECHPHIPPTIEKVRKIAAEVFPDIADQIPTISDQDLRDLCSQRKILIYSDQNLTPTQLASLKTKLEEKGGYGLTKEKRITPRALFETIQDHLHVFMEREDVKSLNKAHKWEVFLETYPLQKLKPDPETFFATYAEKNNGKLSSAQELSETLYREYQVDARSASLANSIRQWGTEIPISEKRNFNYRKVPAGYEEALLKHYEDKTHSDGQTQEFVRRTLGMEPARHYFSRLQKKQQKQFSKPVQPIRPGRPGRPGKLLTIQASQGSLGQVLSNEGNLSQLKNKLKECHPHIPPTIEKVRTIAAEIFPDIADQIPTISDYNLRNLCSRVKILTYSDQNLTTQQLQFLKFKLGEKGGNGLIEEKRITPRALFEAIQDHLHVFMERPDVKSLNKTHKWGIFIKEKPLLELQINLEETLQSMQASYAAKNDGKLPSAQDLSDLLYHEHGIDILSESLASSLRQKKYEDITIAKRGSDPLHSEDKKSLLKHYRNKTPKTSQIQEFTRRTFGKDPSRPYCQRIQAALKAGNEIYQSPQMPIIQAIQGSLGQALSNEGNLSQLKNKLKECHPHIPPTIEKVRTIAAEIFPSIANEIAETSDCDLRDLCSQRKILIYSDQNLTTQQLQFLKFKLGEKEKERITPRELFETIQDHLHIFMEREDIKNLNKTHKWGIFIKEKPLYELQIDLEETLQSMQASYAAKNDGTLPSAQEMSETLYHEHGIDIRPSYLAHSMRLRGSSIQVPIKSDFGHQEAPARYEEALLKHYKNKKPNPHQIQEFARRTLNMEPSKSYCEKIKGLLSQT